MKLVLIGISVVVLTYIGLALINMALVLLFFQIDEGGSPVAAPLILASVEVLVIAGTSFWMPRLIQLLFRTADATMPIATMLYVGLALVCAVSALNIYLDVSLEPLWYKLVRLASLIPAFILGTLRIKPK